MQSLGARFKRERERKGMSLDDVALATKIGTRMLQAIEEDQFNRLPGGIFNKGFVRAYARHLGLDEEQAVSDYLAASGGSAAEKPPETLVAELAARAEESREERRRDSGSGIPWGKLAILLLLIALGFALWGSRDSRPHSRQIHPATAPVDPSPHAQTPDAPAATSRNLAAQPGPPQPDVPASAAPGAKAGHFSVRVAAHADCWLTITADGKEMTHQLLAAGTQKDVDAQQTIVVKAGNVGGLDFWFNGQKLSAQGGTDEVKTLTFVSTGLQAASDRAQLPMSPETTQP